MSVVVMVISGFMYLCINYLAEGSKLCIPVMKKRTMKAHTRLDLNTSSLIWEYCRGNTHTQTHTRRKLRTKIPLHMTTTMTPWKQCLPHRREQGRSSHTHIHTTSVLFGLVRGCVMLGLEAGQNKKLKHRVAQAKSKAKHGAKVKSKLQKWCEGQINRIKSVFIQDENMHGSGSWVTWRPVCGSFPVDQEELRSIWWTKFISA